MEFLNNKRLQFISGLYYADSIMLLLNMRPASVFSISTISPRFSDSCLKVAYGYQLHWIVKKNMLLNYYKFGFTGNLMYDIYRARES